MGSLNSIRFCHANSEITNMELLRFLGSSGLACFFQGRPTRFDLRRTRNLCGLLFQQKTERGSANRKKTSEMIVASFFGFPGVPVPHGSCLSHLSGSWRSGIERSQRAHPARGRAPSEERCSDPTMKEQATAAGFRRETRGSAARRAPARGGRRARYSPHAPRLPRR